MLMKKVVIWGCGILGKKAYWPAQEGGMQVLAYTDSNEELYGEWMYSVPIVSPEELCNLKYDYVMICVYDVGQIQAIKERLHKLGVYSDKIKEMVYEHEYIEAFSTARTKWIHDLSKMIYDNGIAGNVAECGVFQGECAKFINAYFPDKKLYLFDSFEGFDQRDIEYEIGMGNAAYNNSIFTSKEIFDRTSIELVMRKMIYPDNIIIRKGYFPDTAADVDDIFCFVNLDMDLYAPTLNGLRFFWDKVSNGGCILVHDYFHSELPGIKQAIEDFENEKRMNLIKTVIGDGCSIAILK